MKIGRSYKLTEFSWWTRRKLYLLVALVITPAPLYEVLGPKWVAVPWSVAALLGETDCLSMLPRSHEISL